MTRKNENHFGDNEEEKIWMDRPYPKKGGNYISRETLEYNLSGKENRGRPKIIWSSSVQKDIGEEGNSWRKVKQLVQDFMRGTPSAA